MAGHAGQVLCGKLGGQPVIVFQGRFHYYEGHDLETVTFPVRVIQELGVKVSDPDGRHRGNRARAFARAA